MATLSTSCALSDSEDQRVDSSQSEPVYNSISKSNEITLKERVQICLKLKYQMRKLKNKGAIVVLVWNFIVTCVYKL